MPYASFELRQFCDEFHIVQKTSIPRYPRGNGSAERAFCTAKSMLKKNGLEKLDISLEL